MDIFNRHTLAQHHERAKSLRIQHDFLWRHCAQALQDRFLDIKRDFDVVVESGMGRYVLTPEFLQQKKIADPVFANSLLELAPEEILPFASAGLDGFISLGDLQWVNDVPGILLQIKQALRPDGLFIAAFFGGDTLQELRASLAAAETELYGGVSPRVSPFISLQDMAALMQRAQFALPVVDHDLVTVTYADLRSMVADLRGMGQTNAVTKRNKAWRSRQFWQRAEEIYRENFSTDTMRLKATVEIIYVLGWAPDASQPKALPRGSATVPLADILKRHGQE